MHSLRVDPTHKPANSNKDSITTGAPTEPKQGMFLKHPDKVIKGTALLGCPLHKATLLRLGVLIDLPKTHKQIQRGSQNGKT